MTLSTNKTLLITMTLSAIMGAACLFNGGTPDVVVTNFEECVAAGNPVMESYPRQCRHESVPYVEELDQPFNNTRTSAEDAPPGSIHNLPVPEAVAAARAKIASDLGVREGIVIVMTAYERTWTNGCLDLQEPGEICTRLSCRGMKSPPRP